MKLIDEKELAELLRDSYKLGYLEAGGVDNWCDYGISLEDYHYDELDDEVLTEGYEDYEVSEVFL